jgi:hypothetical protein
MFKQKKTIISFISIESLRVVTFSNPSLHLYLILSNPFSVSFLFSKLLLTSSYLTFKLPNLGSVNIFFYLKSTVFVTDKLSIMYIYILLPYSPVPSSVRCVHA